MMARGVEGVDEMASILCDGAARTSLPLGGGESEIMHLSVS
jgi:hypothetical protein